MKLAQNNKKNPKKETSPKKVEKSVRIEKKEDAEIKDVFMKFHQKFITCLRKEADNLNFTISQLDILKFIVDKKSPTMKDIASHLNITAPSATSMIENLYDKKMVNRENDPNDRRGVRISPAQTTLKLFASFKDIKAGVVDELFLPLTAEDKKQLADAGAVLCGYVPNNAFAVKMDVAALRRVAALPGEVPLMCTSPLPTLPHIKSGKLKALAMTGRARSRALPEVPTVAESGLTGFQSSLWYALMAPAGTPTAVIQRLNTETARIVRLPAVSEQLLAQGADPIGNSPQELTAFLRADIERWKKVVREAKITSH